jgi:hypothetical protein
MERPHVRFTVCRLMILAFGASSTAAVLGAALLLTPAQARPPGQVTLLGTLAEWKYPGSTMLDGASMSDGGHPLVQSVKCRAILTTPDPTEKVIEFYSRKVETRPAPARQDAGAEVKAADARAVAVEDDSEGRPVTVRVIVVNKADTATTLVISRAMGEKETHIAWLHYLWLDRKQIPAGR